MNNIMKLASIYADKCADVREYLGGNAGIDEADPYWVAMKEAEAALEAALEQQAAEIERLNARWAEWKDSLNSVMEQRNALQAKLSAVEKQEPVAWRGIHDSTDLYYRKPQQVDVMPLYASPADKDAGLVADGWQPIETAPKDGRPVWVRGKNFGEIGRGLHYCWAYFDGVKWYEPGFESSMLQYLTHWMPIPAAPAIGGQQPWLP